MEKMQSFAHNKWGKFVLAGGLLLSAVGCANFSGKGNEFDVKAKITNVGERSIAGNVYEINLSNGESGDWFDVNTPHRFHNNCDCHGTWSGRKTYGAVFNKAGHTIELSDLSEGDCVELKGKVRADSEGKYTEDRPVYDSAQIVNC